MDGLGNHECEPIILTEKQCNYWLELAKKLSPAHVESVMIQYRRQVANLFGRQSPETVTNFYAAHEENGPSNT